ncbi:MAG: pirin family protein [Firmicutes bacterium]|nr:pirin family protein [Bacillota bacterium]
MNTVTEQSSFSDTIRLGRDRGHANHGWLKTYHSFSFADYYDPAHMGFGALRVINEDYVQPGHGFGMHHHRDMEIVTLVLSGQLRHEDSMGHMATMGAYEVQRITAGSGMRHSEHSQGSVDTHLLQIWIEPNVRGVAPSYEQKQLDVEHARGRLLLIAAPQATETGVTLQQDAKIFLCKLHGDEALDYSLDTGRRAYVQVIKGSVKVNGQVLLGGDALKTFAPKVSIENGDLAEVLLFDLP